MSQKTLFKRALSCLIVVFACLTTTLGLLFSNTKTTANAFTPGIMFSQNYRLKSADSLKYMTYSNGLICTSKQAGDSNQFFYLGTNGYNAATFARNGSSSSPKLTVSSNNTYYFSNTNSTNNSVLWDIYRTSEGYYIKSRLTGRYLCVNQGNVVLETQLTHRAYWHFEPAESGRASYFLTANDLGSSNYDSVYGCVNSLISMGYQTEFVEIPHFGQPYVTSGSNRITVYHGHGNPGVIYIRQPDGTNHCIYSENKPNGSYKSEAVASVANKNSYIVFISCYSATGNSDRRSMVEVAYERGAGCVTGFVDTVRGGEHYMNLVLEYMAEDNSITLTAALLKADKELGGKLASDNTAAIPSNRVTLGNSNFSLNMN